MRVIAIAGLLAVLCGCETVPKKVEQKPLIKILEEEDLKDNSFTRKNLGLTFETEKNNFYEVWVNNVLLESQHYFAHESDNAGNMIYHVNYLDRYLKSGSNSIEFIAENESGKRSKKQVALEVGLEDIVLDGIKLKLCKRAVMDIEKNPGRYWVIVRELQALNRIVLPEYHVDTVSIIYNSINSAEQPIPAGGTDNAWATKEGIVLGFGLINEFDGTNEVRDALTHEFGHKLYDSLFLYERCMLEWYCFQMNIFYGKALFLFKDSEYCLMEAAGHPYENGHELFASAFMIRRNYFDDFKRRLSALDANGQELAISVMEIVEYSLDKKKQNYFNDLFIWK